MNTTKAYPTNMNYMLSMLMSINNLDKTASYLVQLLGD